MFWYERNKKARYAVIHIGLNQSVIKASDALIMIFLNYSTVTDFAKLRGWSTSVPRNTAT
ncbi:Uncharacterised protein [Acinetobacter pittii]|jgi:hypothetical protein|uniref:Uncharacterized protein n=1 Tax=Acinetobacter pittii TaxID=48296 RepID=A0A6S4UFZ8_ACIPI|nr:hypothetical protein WP2W18E11_00880 [Acinetobacter pittii]SSP25938.1 Uncharacterised protein [Acinetobacter pittii]